MVSAGILRGFEGGSGASVLCYGGSCVQSVGCRFAGVIRRRQKIEGVPCCRSWAKGLLSEPGTSMMVVAEHAIPVFVLEFDLHRIAYICTFLS